MNGGQKLKEKQKEEGEVYGKKGGERGKRQNKQGQGNVLGEKEQFESKSVARKVVEFCLTHRQMTNKQAPRKQINDGTSETGFRKLHLCGEHTVLISNWKSSSESLPGGDSQP